MKSVCTSIDVATLSNTLQRQLGARSVGQDMRNFANSFLVLQENRHRADDDPYAKFAHSDAVDAVDQTELALQALDRADADEQADVLALMLVNIRD
jgi:molybdopterin/thiamine biosynthesis adenylyltransferase